MLDRKKLNIKNYDKVSYLRKVNPILIVHTVTLMSHRMTILGTNATK